MKDKTGALTLTEAAHATGRSRVTIRRYLDAKRFPNAFMTSKDTGKPPVWMIPISDLLAAGLTLAALHEPRRPSPSQETDSPSGAEVAELMKRLTTAEALAAERERTIGDLNNQVANLTQIVQQALEALTRSRDP